MFNKNIGLFLNRLFIYFCIFETVSTEAQEAVVSHFAVNLSTDGLHSGGSIPSDEAIMEAKEFNKTRAVVATADGAKKDVVEAKNFVLTAVKQTSTGRFGQLGAASVAVVPIRQKIPPPSHRLSNGLGKEKSENSEIERQNFSAKMSTANCIGADERDKAETPEVQSNTLTNTHHRV